MHLPRLWLVIKHECEDTLVVQLNCPNARLLFKLQGGACPEVLVVKLMTMANEVQPI